MSSSFIDYFNKELAYLRKAGAEFAIAHPKIANHLKLHQEGSQDPQIALLLEAFAFLTARVHKKLDDEFPELAASLLNILYPHYQAPIPMMSIAQFEPAKDLTNGVILPAGTMLESDPALGDTCYFKTCYDTSLLPIVLTTVEWMDHLQHAPKHARVNAATNCLRLVFNCVDNEMSFANLSPKKIRLFLNGSSQQTFPVYELLFKKTLALAGASSYQDNQVSWLDSNSIQPVGFAVNEGLLPYPPQSSLGYRLLTEYFIFPQKFLFVDILLDKVNFNNFNNTFEIFIYINNSDSRLQLDITKELFALGCTPTVNLFKHNAEPIHLTQQQYEYEIITDHRRADTFTTYSVDKVVGIDQQGNEIEYLPFYGMKFGIHNQSHPGFWQATRRPADYNAKANKMFIAFTDLDLDYNDNNDQVMHLTTTCMNQTIPQQLIYNKSDNLLQLSSLSAPVSNIRFLTAPVLGRAAIAQHGNYHALLNHLMLNQVSLADEANGAGYLRQILQLYNFDNSEQSAAIANSVLNLKTASSLRRMNLDLVSMYCQGTQITLEIDETQFTGNSAYLFSKVLEIFLTFHCTINTFIQLEVLSKNKKQVIYSGDCNGGKNSLI